LANTGHETENVMHTIAPRRTAAAAGNSKYSAQPRHSRGRDSGRDAGNRRAANPV